MYHANNYENKKILQDIVFAKFLYSLESNKNFCLNEKRNPSTDMSYHLKLYHSRLLLPTKNENIAFKSNSYQVRSTFSNHHLSDRSKKRFDNVKNLGSNSSALCSRWDVINEMIEKGGEMLAKWDRFCNVQNTFTLQTTLLNHRCL